MTRLTKFASLKIYNVDIDIIPVNETVKKTRRKTFKAAGGPGDCANASGSSELLKHTECDNTAAVSESTEIGIKDRKASVYQTVESLTEGQPRSISVNFLPHRKISEYTDLNQVNSHNHLLVRLQTLISKRSSHSGRTFSAHSETSMK
jgi:hypothetical protein